MPIAHKKVGNNAINKCCWNNEGSALVTGDSSGALNLYVLAEKYRKMDSTKYEDLIKHLIQKPESQENK
jgi:hypothetical protein